MRRQGRAPGRRTGGKYGELPVAIYPSGQLSVTKSSPPAPFLRRPHEIGPDHGERGRGELGYSVPGWTDRPADNERACYCWGGEQGRSQPDWPA